MNGDERKKKKKRNERNAISKLILHDKTKLYFIINKREKEREREREMTQCSFSSRACYCHVC
jgi:hypothetical protein